MAGLTFDTQTGRLLKARVEQQLAEIGYNLAAGTARRATSAETAQQYIEEVGYCRCLNDMLAFCAEIEDMLHGRGNKQQ